MNLQSTLRTLTQMLQNHHAHESASHVGFEYKETDKVVNHFRQGMFISLKEKKVQFGIDSGNEEGGIEESLISAELELEDMVNL